MIARLVCRYAGHRIARHPGPHLWRWVKCLRCGQRWGVEDVTS